MRRILLFLLFCFGVCGVAMAGSPPTVGWFFDNWKTNREMGPYSTVAEACSALVALSSDSSVGVSAVLLDSSQLSATSGQCKWQNYINGNKSGDPAFGAVRGRLSCPGNEPVGADGMCPDQPEKCKAKSGSISTMNYTRGWARSSVPNKSDQIGATADVPSSICDSGCKFSVLGNEAAYRSMEPSPQGLYRLSSDVTVIQTDQACSTSEQTSEVKPSTPDKPCPGSVGELNGKPYCAISPGATGVDPVGPPGKESDDKGNPSAGPKPSSGEGSGSGGVGRTPTTGTGGNAGGPASAANGGTGTKPGGTPADGTRDKPQDGKEQAACGAPGQPQCKIDETGTPDGKGVLDKYGQQMADADKSRTDLLASIKEKSDKDTTWGVSFGWVQHGGCQPWVLGTLPVGPGIEMKIDICPILPYIEWVTSFLWALTTFALTISMVFRVTTQSGD